jgi:hypothetical protein
MKSIQERYEQKRDAIFATGPAGPPETKGAFLMGAGAMAEAVAEAFEAAANQREMIRIHGQVRRFVRDLVNRIAAPRN